MLFVIISVMIFTFCDKIIVSEIVQNGSDFAENLEKNPIYSVNKSFLIHFGKCVKCRKISFRNQILPNTSWARCMHIRSNKTRNYLHPEKDNIYERPVFIRSGNSDKLNVKWDVYGYSNGLHTVNVAYGNLIWQKRLGCNSNATEIVLFQTKTPSKFPRFGVKIEQIDHLVIFSLEICGKCIYVDIDGRVKIKNYCSGDDDSYFFLSAPPPNEICSLIPGVFIRTKRTNFYLHVEQTKNEEMIIGADFVHGSLLLLWDVYNYLHYTIIKLSHMPDYIWDTDSGTCERTNHIVIRNIGEEFGDSNKFLINWDPESLEFNMIVCNKPVIFARERNGLYTNTQHNRYDKLFYMYEKGINSRCDLIKNIFIRVLPDETYLGVNKIDNNESIVAGRKDKMKLQNWDIYICPGYLKIKPLNNPNYSWSHGTNCGEDSSIYLSETIDDKNELHSKIFLDRMEPHIFHKFEVSTLMMCWRCLFIDRNSGFTLWSRYNCSNQITRLFQLSHT